jgi:hypothetical protein
MQFVVCSPEGAKAQHEEGRVGMAARSSSTSASTSATTSKFF